MRCADIILLNKVDLVKPGEVAVARHLVAAVAPAAQLVGCSFCDVQLPQLLAVDRVAAAREARTIH